MKDQRDASMERLSDEEKASFASDIVKFGTWHRFHECQSWRMARGSASDISSHRLIRRGCVVVRVRMDVRLMPTQGNSNRVSAATVDRTRTNNAEH